jgi:hypothetical protein
MAEIDCNQWSEFPVSMIPCDKLGFSFFNFCQVGGLAINYKRDEPNLARG